METGEQLWRDLFAAAENMKSVQADSRRVSMFYQITVSQLKMVRTVYGLTSLSENGIALKSLAQKLGTTAAAASEMVDVLVRKKILERRQDPGDRRQVQIRLVAELHEQFRRIEEGFTCVSESFLETLVPGERESFIRNVAAFAAFTSGNVSKTEL